MRLVGIASYCKLPRGPRLRCGRKLVQRVRRRRQAARMGSATTKGWARRRSPLTIDTAIGSLN